MSKTQFLNLSLNSKPQGLSPLNPPLSEKKSHKIRTFYTQKPGTQPEPNKPHSLPKQAERIAENNPIEKPHESKESKKEVVVEKPKAESPQAKTSTHKKSLENLSEKEIRLKIENFKQEQNREMLMILQEEQNNEAEREALLRKSSDQKEKKKLENAGNLKRARALERIQEVSQ